MPRERADPSPAPVEDLEAGSPQFSIAAVKPAPPAGVVTLHLHAWPATRGHELPAAADVVQPGPAEVASSSGTGISLDAAAEERPPWGGACVTIVCREQSEPSKPAKPVASASPASEGGRRQLTVQRWQRAGRAVMQGRQVAAAVETLGHRLAPTAERLHAAVLLAVRLEACSAGKQQQLAWALLARRHAGRVGWADHLLNELYITGEQLFSFFAPPPMGSHRPYFIPALAVGLALVFFFMAGQYGQYQALVNPASSACLLAAAANGTAPAWGPGGMARWVSPRAEGWCYGGKTPGKFDAAFLIDSGARWAPDMRKRPHRWLTSALLHQSFSHLLSNLLLLLVLGLPMESKHGTWRVAAVAVLCALGGNLFSAVTEAPCTAVVGTSGVVFGMAGLTLADMALNFETLARPVLRAAVLLALLVFFAVAVGTTPAGTSHMSHVGGLLCGLLPGLVLLPNPHRSAAEAAAAGLAAAGCAAVFAVLPALFYLRQLPAVHC